MPRAEILKNADAKKAAEFFRTAGIKSYQFVVGQLETTVDGRTFRADGVTLADGTVLVRLDSEEYTATQLAKHEGYHIIAQRNAEMAQRIRKRMVAEGKISKAQIDSYIDAYNAIYGDNTDAYVEEIVADAYAGINRTAYGGNAVGQTIKLGAYKFRIVGVLKAKISNHDQQEGSDDDSVYLPYTTAMRLSNESTPDSYSAIMVDEGQANEAKAAVEQGLYDIFKSDNAYYVYSASEWLEEMNKMINMVIVILTGIASISLLVGGIGIMNIMLVSVTERTREIGIRKALGAQESTILTQFVVEAGVTSALGGCFGIVLGYIVSAIINQILPYILTDITLNVTPSADAAAIAVGISCGIGVLFGFLPARRAASLNPIEALRYD